MIIKDVSKRVMIIEGKDHALHVIENNLLSDGIYGVEWKKLGDEVYEIIITYEVGDHFRSKKMNIPKVEHGVINCSHLSETSTELIDERIEEHMLQMHKAVQKAFDDLEQELNRKYRPQPPKPRTILGKTT